MISIAYRKVLRGAWSRLSASGACDLILIAIIVYGWPLSAAWTLALMVGVNLLTTGYRDDLILRTRRVALLGGGTQQGIVASV